jgi:metallo-beta-lactamase family protein
VKLTFIGATHEVTGSCYYLEACGRRILIDCGMEQGANYYENVAIPVAPGEIDCVLLTHAHIDHSGLLPLLYHNGFRGTVYSTEATHELCTIMLRDSAHIQMFEAEWRNRKGKRAGLSDYVPLYTMEDADGIISQFKGYTYNHKIDLYDGIAVRFIDVGHLLGSSSIEIFLTEEGVSKNSCFPATSATPSSP